MDTSPHSLNYVCHLVCRCLPLFPASIDLVYRVSCRRTFSKKSHDMYLLIRLHKTKANLRQESRDFPRPWISLAIRVHIGTTLNQNNRKIIWTLKGVGYTQQAEIRMATSCIPVVKSFEFFFSTVKSFSIIS